MNKTLFFTLAILALFFFSHVQCFLAGGSQPQDAAECQVAADFAIAELNSRANSINANNLSLVKVERCETQVVAGINYRMRLLVQSASNNAVHAYVVTVYEKLFADENGNKFSLTKLNIE